MPASPSPDAIGEFVAGTTGTTGASDEAHGTHDATAAPLRSAATTRLGLALLTILAFALRAHRLAAQSLWSDEDITLDRAGQSLAELLAGLPVEQSPGYYVLMRGWTLLAGDGDLALRFPSLLAGVLAVPLAGFVGARLADRDTGLLLALIVATSPFLVYYGQEARMYALLLSLALAATAAMLQAVRTGRTGWWAACGALVAATLYTHYYGALIVVGLAGWASFDLLARDRARLRGWATAGLTAALLFGPWLPRALGVLAFEGWRGELTLGEAPLAHATDWLAGRTLPDGHPALWIPLAAAMLGLLLLLLVTVLETRFSRARHTGVDRYGARRGLALQLLPLLAYALVVLRTAELGEGGWAGATVDYDPRYAMAALPGLYLMVASGASLLALLVFLPAYLLTPLLPAAPRRAIDGALRRSRGGAATGLAAVLLVLAALPGLRDLYGNPAAQKQDYRGFVAAVEAEARHEDTVLLLDGPNYGLTRRYEIEDSPVKIVNLHSSGNLERGPEARQAYVAELAATFPHVWLAEDGARMGEAKAWLDAHAYPVADEGYQDITLRRYYRPVLAAKDPARLLEGEDPAPSGRFLTDIGIHEDVRHPGRPRPLVTCWGFAVSPLAAGEILPVALSCRITEATDRELKVSVRLLEGSDARARIVSSDRRPVNWTRPTSGWSPSERILDRHALLLPRDLAPGDYVIEVVLYDEETLEEVENAAGWVTVEPAR